MLKALGDAISPKKNDELINMNMIFIDEKFQFSNDLLKRFKDKLSEGSVLSSRTSKLLKALGDSISPKKNSELNSMDMIFIDERVLIPLFFFLSNLVYGRYDFTITVRLCRMCDANSPKKNDELISMDMIFIN
ncbi:hypothetical protein H5410_037357 [Solanum commersonii]|uniref:Uncharacterized protein n=1 Tax=Solanum commersonii TaxID=4109 RepID=A0A9J5Y7K7_SOLCO|nr:hypothetical protein H5410_037357 [Solanum commersonii]